MGQVEFQPEPIISEADKPLGTEFSSENYSFFQNPESNLSDVGSILNSENIVVLENEDKEYKGWTLDEGISSSNGRTESRFKKTLRKIAVPAGGAIAAILVACGGGSEGSTDESPTGIPTQTEAAATVAENTPTPESSVNPSVEPTVEKTPKSEVVVETPCQILPEEICKQAEVINYKAEGNEDTMILGFKDIPEGTPILAPVSGDVIYADFGNGTPGGWKGRGVVINFTPDGKSMGLIIGDLGFDSVGFNAENAGEQIATVQSSGIDNFGYKLLVQFIIQEGEKFRDNNEAYNLYFPEIIKKEPVGEIHRTQTQATFAGYDFVE